MDEVIDGTAVDLEPPTAHAPAPATPTTELVRQPTRDVLMPLDVTQVVDGMRTYQRLLHDLLAPSDWQGTGDDRFLKKSGWRKIARAFNLSLEKVDSGVEYLEDGETPKRAWSTYRAIAPNGQTQDGDGYCALSEFHGKRRNDKKLENTMRATATTRAKNRAISDLVGMGEVSAEEMDTAEAAPAGPPFGVAADGPTTEKALAAIAYLLDIGDGPDEARADAVLDKAIKDAGGYLPRIVARAYLWTAAELKAALNARDAAADAETGAPVDPVAQDMDNEPAEALVVDQHEEPVATFNPATQTMTPGERASDDIEF